MSFSFQTYKPVGILSGLVDHFWHVSGISDNTGGVGLPQTCMGLVINLGAHHHWYRTNTNTPEVYDKFWIQGLMNGTMRIETLGLSEMIGVKFKPGCAAYFLGHPAHAFSNEQVKADLLWGTSISSLRQRLLETAFTAQRFAVLESFLCNRFANQADSRNHQVVNFALQQIHCAGADHSVTDICRATGISRKHLVSIFKEHVGMSTKHYGRLVRFNRAVQLLSSNTMHSLTATAYSLDYYDQAHFIKEFQLFSGLTPGNYLKAKPANPFFIGDPAP